MAELFYVVSRSVNFLLTALTWLLMGRALLSFFTDEESLLYNFCCIVTEPVVAPVRGLMSKVGLDESPIDFSFMITCFIIILVQSALPY